MRIAISLTFFVAITSTKIASVSTAPNSSYDRVTVNFDGNVANQAYYKKLITLQESESDIILNISGNPSFFVFQVHSFLESVHLLSTSQEVSGTNIGLIQNTSNPNEKHDFFISGNGTVLLVVNLYSAIDPLPGRGPSNVPNPSINISYNNDLVHVSAALSTCYWDNGCNYEIYFNYLPATAYTPAAYAYFEALENMLSVDKIRSNGIETFKYDTIHDNINSYHSNYQGHGIIYAIILHNNDSYNGSTAYVPTISYGCDVSHGIISCYGSWYINEKIMTGLLVIAGLAIAYMGERSDDVSAFFNLIFFFIELCNIAVSILLLRRLETSVFVSLYITLPIAILFSLLVLYVLRMYRLRFLFNHIPAAYIFSAFILSIPVISECIIFQSDLMYWCMFLGIMLSLLLLLLALGQYSNITMALTYLTLGNNYLLGGSLNYVILNNLRRMTNQNFDIAVISLPWQTRDFLSFFIAAMLLLILKRIGRVGRMDTIGEYTPLLA